MGMVKKVMKVLFRLIVKMSLDSNMVLEKRSLRSSISAYPDNIKTNALTTSWNRNVKSMLFSIYSLFTLLVCYDIRLEL